MSSKSQDVADLPYLLGAFVLDLLGIVFQCVKVVAAVVWQIVKFVLYCYYEYIRLKNEIKQRILAQLPYGKQIYYIARWL